MPEALQTLGAILTVISISQYAQEEDVSVYVNGNQVAQQEQPYRREPNRGEQIIQEALERREQILLANQRAISTTHLR
jgi:hypothetical protein